MRHQAFARRIMIPFVVSLAMFMEAIDGTVINTAIPSMSSSLNINPIDLKIALISYLLSLAIFIPISGWVADKYGIKRVFLIALSIFMVSSFFCALANTLTQLVIARIFQGMGGSFMLPLGRLIIVSTYQKHELVNKMSQVVVVGALGMMLGPTLGGVITQHLSWRWIFYINIPVGLLNIILAYRWLEHVKPKAVPKLDIKGLLLFGSALCLLTFGLSAVTESHLGIFHVLIDLFSSFILFVLYYFHSRKQSHPVVNTKLFGFKTFYISILGNLFSRLSFGGLLFALSLLLQICLGYSPQVAGFLFAPTAIGVLVVKPFSFRILQTLGFKNLLIGNTILIGLLLFAFSGINEMTSFAMIGFLNFLFGALTALQYTGANSIAYSEITTEYYSAATSVMSTMQQISQSLGVAVTAILIQVFSDHFFKSEIISLISIRYTFLSMGLLTFSSILVFLQIKPRDGAALLIKKNNTLNQG